MSHGILTRHDGNMHDLDSQKRGHILEVVASWKKERPDLDLANFLLGISVIRLGRVLDDAYDRLCRKRFGISGADMRVLLSLRRAGKPYTRRPTDLFRGLLVTSGAMTKQVDRLSKLGLVERLEGPADASGILIKLTAKGLKVANSATEMLVKKPPIGPGTQSLTHAERVAGERFIERVLVNLEAEARMPGKSRPASTRKRKRA
jgi:DNA-binding MarR family transcriptional regulator